MKTLKPEDLLEAARKSTGLDDFGDLGFMEPLGILVRALNMEARLNEMGRARALFSLRATLESRLKVEDYLRRHPEVLEQRIERPLFIVGLPRTGTTVLQHLLNCDPGNHTLRLWEGNDPVPPPRDETYESDPRIAASEASAKMVSTLMPDFKLVHLLAGNAPDECIMLLARDLTSVEYPCFFNVPSYRKWLYGCDLRPAYRYYRKQLQLLQSQKSGLWALKTPMHRLALDVIFELFPDACAVETQRDTAELLASGSSFLEIMRRSCSDAIELDQIGRDWFEMLRVYSERFVAAKRQVEFANAGSVLKLAYVDLVDDPLAAVARVYEFSGRELSEVARLRMEDWLEQNPQNKHGEHKYSLERYGLGAEQVRLLDEILN